MTKDLRTIGAEERQALRVIAVEEVQKCGNISKVSKDLGINRQVLHSWLNKFDSAGGFDNDKRGRIKQKIYEAHVRKILEIMAHNLPVDLGIDNIFWSVSAVQALIGNTLDISASSYLVRRWLLDWGFFRGRNTDLFEMSSDDLDGLTVREFADKCNMPCYISWKAYVSRKVVSCKFQCVSSKRGDIRFVGGKKGYEGYLQEESFLNRLQEIAKKNIVVVYDEDNWVYLMGIYNLSDSVTLFRKSKGKLVDARA